MFLRDIHEGHLSTEKAGNKQSNFTNELKNFDKGIKTLERIFLKIIQDYYLVQEKKFFSSFKSR